MKLQRSIRPTQVLVLAAERVCALADRAAALADAAPIEFRRSPDDRHDAPPTDVVLTDRLVSAAQLRSALGGWRGYVGRVYVGVEPSGAIGRSLTATLPADATPREIHVACTLLADAVRWRRRLSARTRHEQRLRRLSLSDPLTGVANLRAWNARLAATCRRVRREGAEACVALFDVDLFKPINDTHGHAAGDDVLRAVAGRLVESVHDGDFVARLGGDEFGVILANLPREHGDKIVERVRRQTCEAVSTRAAQRVAITASAGWAPIGEADDAKSVVARADVALRAAKQSGRNQTHFGGAIGASRGAGIV